MDYYDVLGVNKNASEEQLKKAYKKASMQHHPDRNGGSEEKFKQINEAYSTLKDPQKRQQYDNPQPQFTSQHFNNGGFAGGFDINDLMGQFGFGARQQMRNQDITIGCNISIAEAYTGKTVIATYRLNNGREQTVEIKVPKGINNGDRIRYGAMGQHDIQQIPPGDLYVVIAIQGNRQFQLDGINLLTTQDIDVFDCILGTSIPISLPDGTSVKLNIPKGTQPNTIFSINGKGLPDRKNGRTGNILVKIITKIPTNLNTADIQRIERIRGKI